jgi:hypothetical protein
VRDAFRNIEGMENEDVRLVVKFAREAINSAMILE